jgi:hypothetical protein
MLVTAVKPIMTRSKITADARCLPQCLNVATPRSAPLSAKDGTQRVQPFLLVGKDSCARGALKLSLTIGNINFVSVCWAALPGGRRETLVLKCHNPWVTLLAVAISVTLKNDASPVKGAYRAVQLKRRFLQRRNGFQPQVPL